jgi:hypothetical protein
MIRQRVTPESKLSNDWRRNIAHLAALPAFRFVELDVLDRAKSPRSWWARRVAGTRASSIPAGIAAGPAMFRVFATILGWQPRRHSTEPVRYAVERILANGF